MLCAGWLAVRATAACCGCAKLLCLSTPEVKVAARCSVEGCVKHDLTLLLYGSVESGFASTDGRCLPAIGLFGAGIAGWYGTESTRGSLTFYSYMMGYVVWVH